MLLHLTAFNLNGEIPQEVKDQKPWWYALLGLLVLTLVVRIVALDLAGAMLSGLMLGFGIVIVRDDMAGVDKYNIVFGLLCSLNFFFDVLPLLAMMGGRRKEEITPSKRTLEDDTGYGRETFSVTVKTYPFFDRSQGLVYNAESLSMILSSLCMLMGAILSFRAHDIIMREAPPLDWDGNFAAGALGPGNGLGPGGRPLEPRRPLVVGGDGYGGQPRAGAHYGTRQSFDFFQGQGQRLSAVDEPRDAACEESGVSARNLVNEERTRVAP